ncbi:amidohydrolase family protein [Aliikangiella sp. G2MR2-5]|uniref:amidohydrolase family protein n=1 Tax=Aliikangiella sp. G2MR2-5 TaxID=2788943 RepID=UPI0018A9DE39|nr:amidohydrolase family protein [Aliikangiella sp. G2MR2-5]
MNKLLQYIFSFFIILCTVELNAAPADAPQRQRGEGPFERLILRGVTLINGEGAPARGPVDIVIEGNVITQIQSVGSPGVPIVGNRPKAEAGDKVLELEGHYVFPGFVDMHGHIGNSAQVTTAEYTYKLWLAHGITTVREPGSFNGADFTLNQVRKSQKNQITAPRIIPYFGFGLGETAPISDAEKARSWVKKIAKKGARGIKFFGTHPDIFSAAVDEARKRGLRTMMHHAQLDVAHLNAMDSARIGLTSMEHWYGLPEAMFTDQVIQNYPIDYNYNNEQHRFSEAGKLWLQAALPGSVKWNTVRDELIGLDFTINPTLTIYEANRDLMREKNADWHAEYTLPGLWEFFTASRYTHGSYHFDWTTQEEINWKNNFRRWMTFLNDYKNHGGRVTTGSDSGYIYKIYGFGFVRELELLQEAGFHPLEVMQSATIKGAEALGMDHQIGSVSVGKLADLVISKENPLQNFKTLYGTGFTRLNDDNNLVKVGGVKYTIKDGIIFDASQLLADVRAIVKNEKDKQIKKGK